jgi:uncharacterized protein (TIRG00374 family)
VIRGRTLLRILVLVACVAALAWTIRSLDPEKVLEALEGAHAGWLAVSIVFVLVRYVIWGVKWTRMIRRDAPIETRPVLQSIMAGSFVNLTTPTAKLAGGFLRAAIVSRLTGLRLATAYGWALADQVTNVLGYMLLGGASALLATLSLPEGKHEGRYLVAGGVMLGGLVLAAALREPVWRLAAHPRPARWLARITPKRFRHETAHGSAAAWLAPVFAPTLKTGSTLKDIPVDLLLACASWGSMCVANALVFRAMGVPVSVSGVAFALILASVLGTVSPGGIGATEAVLISLLIAQGIPGDVAAAGALVHRATYYVVILVWGGVALVGARKLAGSSGPNAP